jgi:hypothetical protein
MTTEEITTPGAPRARALRGRIMALEARVMALERMVIMIGVVLALVVAFTARLWLAFR